MIEHENFCCEFNIIKDGITNKHLINLKKSFSQRRINEQKY